MGKLIRTSTAALLLLSAACTTSQQTVPPLAGPSEFALSLRVTATPDSISKDGASQSAIAVNAFDANGKPVAGLALRMDMAVDGSVVDFGALSARTIVTNNNGQATTVYTAPPSSPLDGGFGTVVTIVATPTTSNFDTVTPQIATIRLVPTGVILPPAGSPTAAFTLSPQPVTVNVPTIFDASTSQPGSGARSISSYRWDFGDGGTAAGRTTSYVYRTTGTFNVTLTVTNDRGLSASTTQTLTTSAPDTFTGTISFSPQKPAPGQKVLFSAVGIQAAPGHSIVQYTWSFGDSAAPAGTNTASGTATPDHTYTNENDYVVLLTVVDDLGRQKTISLTVSVKFPTAEATP